MSYTDSVREQLYNVEIKNRCCIFAEYAAVRLCLSSNNDDFGKIIVSSKNQDYIKRLQFLCYKTQNFKPEIVTYLKKSKKTKEENMYYELELPQYKIKSEAGENFEAFSQKECCGKAFIRGLFMMRGTVTAPEVRSVHLESGFKSEELRDVAVEIMQSHGLNVKKGTRRDTFTYYIKDTDSVADFLSLIGAPKARFDFDNAKAMREINNQSNRAINADVANFDKVSISSSKHLAAIRFLFEHDMYDSLPRELKSVADIRMQYPDASLAVLCEKHVPQLSKAGLNHRLKKIIQIAEDAEKNLF
ncbi:MAG: DNA-binding protein WhiA [Clostridia bacterium]|nr:DNA-binding protein WhiA [Clostridia bacterium]